MANNKNISLFTVGWRERLALPDLGISNIKAKVDTGAKSSALHASHLHVYDYEGARWLRFMVHWDSPRQTVEAHAKLLEYRKIKSSNGKVQRRPVIQTHVRMFGCSWLIDVTLTQRDSMQFPMLLGRQALRHHAIVDVSQSYLNKGVL